MATNIDHRADRRVVSEARGTTVYARRRALIASFVFAAFLWLVLIGTTPFQEWTLQPDAAKSDVINQVLYICITLVLLFGTGVPTRSGLFGIPLGIAILLGYCFFSVSWAIAPLVSLRRIIQTSMVIWLVFRCLDDLGPNRMLRFVRLALIALLVINYLTVFFTPYGIHADIPGEYSSLVGDWRGIIPHKNVAGAICSLTILLFLFDNREFPKALSAAVIVGSVIFLYFTQSRTSEVALVPAILLGIAIRPYDASKRTVAVVFLLIVSVFAILLFSGSTSFLANILNDPYALTGRGAIWPLLLEYAGEHPWTGAGFGSFWLIGDASPIWSLTSGWVAIYAAHGHNGFLDLLVTIGLPGLILAIFALGVWPMLRLLLSPSIDKSHRSLLLAMIAFCLGHNLTESTLLSATAVVEVFLIMAIALAYRETNAAAGSRRWLRQRVIRWLPRASRRGGMRARPIR